VVAVVMMMAVMLMAMRDVKPPPTAQAAACYDDDARVGDDEVSERMDPHAVAAVHFIAVAKCIPIAFRSP
jgi:hypothetical protein